MTRLAPAKINLTLEILGLRSDGFHEIRSVMHAVTLCDRLSFSPAPGGIIELRGGCADAPPDESNLVFRAARALLDETGSRDGVTIALEKRIPVGAGLGGGSSDAATTLTALNDLFETGVSTEGLAAIAAGLGSDVPFFLAGGCALAEGRGEALTPLPAVEGLPVVIAKPAEGLSTARVYREFSQSASRGSLSPGASLRMEDALRGGATPESVAASLFNALEETATRLCPPSARLLEAFRAAGALGALISGSGSAAFALAKDDGAARFIANDVEARGFTVWVTHTTSASARGGSA